MTAQLAYAVAAAGCDDNHLQPLGASARADHCPCSCWHTSMRRTPAAADAAARALSPGSNASQPSMPKRCIVGIHIGDGHAMLTTYEVCQLAGQDTHERLEDLTRNDCTVTLLIMRHMLNSRSRQAARTLTFVAGKLSARNCSRASVCTSVRSVSLAAVGASGTRLSARASSHSRCLETLRQLLHASSAGLGHSSCTCAPRFSVTG